MVSVTAARRRFVSHNRRRQQHRATEVCCRDSTEAKTAHSSDAIATAQMAFAAVAAAAAASVETACSALATATEQFAKLLAASQAVEDSRRSARISSLPSWSLQARGSSVFVLVLLLSLIRCADDISTFAVLSGTRLPSGGRYSGPRFARTAGGAFGVRKYTWKFSVVSFARAVVFPLCYLASPSSACFL